MPFTQSSHVYPIGDAFNESITYPTFSPQNEAKLNSTPVTWGFSFLGGGFGPFFALWSISSHVGVQIGLELV